MSWHVVASVDEIAPGASKLCTVGGREIGIFNVKGSFYALSNKCPHEGASLCKGQRVGLAEADEPGQYRLSREGELLRCPWHGWEFDILTGQSWCDPTRTKVKSFHVKVESGEAIEKLGDKTKGPYVAETFPVTVDNNYIMIDV